MERRLAAILAADMVGYSRLMEIDEVGTHARLKTHRLELIDPAIAKNNGRIIKTTGDGMLVEFHSVVDAVSCAVEIQSRMGRRNTDVAPDRRIEFRVGVNLGDVIAEDGDIFGDGVNIAARLQEVSDIGGVCVSSAVVDQVGEKLGVVFQDLGEQAVKNIARKIRIYRVALDEAAAPAPARSIKKESRGRESELPSIAVLPFVNMSGDAEQDFFADGLTEDILTELSRFRELFVISRTSAFAYKGRSANVQKVARELGVQYVVEGSVRKAGKRVRVTAQLIDAQSDRHVWAERFDRDLEDIFAIQDEITTAIVAVLPGRVHAAAQERVKNKPTENMAAYEYALTGKVLHHRSNPADNGAALEMLDKAIALDPKYAHAHAWRACVLGQAWVHGWCEDRDSTWEKVSEELQIALSLNENDSDVHRILAAVSLAHDDHDRAMYHEERALALNPNDDLIVVQKGEILTWIGQAEEGVEWIRKAMRLNPYHPERFWSHLGRAYFVARRYAEAIEAFKRITNLDYTHCTFLAAASARLGDQTAAREWAQATLRREPGFTVEDYLDTMHYKRESDLAHHRDALLETGLPWSREKTAGADGPSGG